MALSRIRPIRSFPSLRSLRLHHSAVVSVLLLAMLLGMAQPGAAAAQSEFATWEAASEGDVTVIMEPNERLSASSFLDAYGHFAQTAIDETTLLLDLGSADRPVEIVVFADLAAFEDLASSLDRNDLDSTIVAADAPGSRILAPLRAFIDLPPLEAENQLRHAVAHVMSGKASGFAIPRGFDEGFARYVERPNHPVLARLASLVHEAHRDGDLISWSNMNRREPLDDTLLVEAQAVSAVAYLLQQHGLLPFRQFLMDLRTAPTWRDAMSSAYGASSPGASDLLERQWRDEIPFWVQGEWRWNLVSGFDLAPARDLLARGHYEGAANALLISEQLLVDIDAPALREEVDSLKEQARTGALAESKMIEAQTALENFAYDRALAAVTQAEEQYRLLPGEVRPIETIEEYERLARMGLEAVDALEIARYREGAWGEFPEARASALEAGARFAALGDQENRDAAAHVIERIDQQRLRFVMLLGSLSALTLAWLFLWMYRRRPHPLRWDRAG
jgi:hypothetical protein